MKSQVTTSGDAEEPGNESTPLNIINEPPRSKPLNNDSGSPDFTPGSTNELKSNYGNLKGKSSLVKGTSTTHFLSTFTGAVIGLLFGFCVAVIYNISVQHGRSSQNLAAPNEQLGRSYHERNPRSRSSEVTVDTEHPQDNSTRSDYLSADDHDLPSLAATGQSTIESWLRAKQVVFGTSYNKSIVGDYLTGPALESVVGANASIDWLREKRQYYTYGNYSVKPRVDSVIGNARKIIMDVEITENLCLHIPAKSPRCKIESGVYRFDLVRDGDSWKIYDRKKVNL